MRQISPLTTGSHHIVYGVDDASPANFVSVLISVADEFLFGDEFFDDLPLSVGQVCVIMGFHFHVTPFVEKD